MGRYEIGLNDKTILRLDVRPNTSFDRRGDVVLRCFLVFRDGESIEIDYYLARDLFATTRYALKKEGGIRTLFEALADQEAIRDALVEEGLLRGHSHSQSL